MTNQNPTLHKPPLTQWWFSLQIFGQQTINISSNLERGILDIDIITGAVVTEPAACGWVCGQTGSSILWLQLLGSCSRVA